MSRFGLLMRVDALRRLPFFVFAGVSVVCWGSGGLLGDLRQICWRPAPPESSVVSILGAGLAPFSRPAPFLGKIASGVFDY